MQFFPTSKEKHVHRKMLVALATSPLSNTRSSAGKGTAIYRTIIIPNIMVQQPMYQHNE